MNRLPSDAVVLERLRVLRHRRPVRDALVYVVAFALPSLAVLAGLGLQAAR